MKYRILDALECPVCRSPLELLSLEESVSEKDGEFRDKPLCKFDCTFGKAEPEHVHDCRKCFLHEIETGLLLCSNETSHIYPVINCIPRMLPDALSLYIEQIRNHDNGIPEGIKVRLNSSLNRAAASLEKEFIHIQKSFSSEWNEISDENRAWGQDIGERRELFFKCVQLQAPDIRGKKILDAGCGHGEIEFSIEDCEAEIFAVDLSSSVDIIQRRLLKTADRITSNIYLVQGNVHYLPFRSDYFDIVHSAGVLHHTPDTLKGFREITRTLLNGGISFIEVYSLDHKNILEKLRYHLTNLFRIITKHLPHPLLHAFCYMLAPLHWLYVNSFNRLSGKKRYTSRTIRETELSLFDGFSPLFDWHHSSAEVHYWFEQLRYVNIIKTFYNHNGIGFLGTMNRDKAS